MVSLFPPFLVRIVPDKCHGILQLPYDTAFHVDGVGIRVNATLGPNRAARQVGIRVRKNLQKTGPTPCGVDPVWSVAFPLFYFLVRLP